MQFFNRDHILQKSFTLWISSLTTSLLYLLGFVALVDTVSNPSGVFVISFACFIMLSITYIFIYAPIKFLLFVFKINKKWVTHSLNILCSTITGPTTIYIENGYFIQKEDYTSIVLYFLAIGVIVVLFEEYFEHSRNKSS